MVLWVPVLLGVGIIFYFSLKSEPSWGITLVPLVVVCSAICVGGRMRLFRNICIVFALAASGFALAKTHTHLVGAPFLQERLFSKIVEGKLLKVESDANAVRLLIQPYTIQSLDNGKLPAKVRLVWRRGVVSIPINSVIRVRATLSPPPYPVLPGGYDFGRQLYFEQIGAVGYAEESPVAVDVKPANAMAGKVEELRFQIAARIRSVLAEHPAHIAGICIALVTGDRFGLAEESEQALRDSGLAHLLAISGLHMGLVAGLIFFFARWALASFEYIALHYPIKKWAAVAALLGAFGYFLISGAGWSTRRAFIMVVVFFVAIILDRRGVSLRNVAIAATFILVTSPQAITQAGFHMSFAAVTVLIAAYEWWQRRSMRGTESYKSSFGPGGHFRKFVAYVGGLSATSILAGIATAPFAMAHFNRLAAYGLIGNLLAMPVMAFWIMPCAVAAIVLMPLGLDQFLWVGMAYGVQVVLFFAGTVSSWSGAVALIPSISKLVFGFWIIGGIILCLCRSNLRLGGAALILVGTVFLPVRQLPDVIVSETGRNAIIRIPSINNYEAIALTNRLEQFDLENWLRYWGMSIEPRQLRTIKKASDQGVERVFCSEILCEVVINPEFSMYILNNAGDLHDLCKDDAIILPVTQDELVEHNERCTVLGPQYLKRNGAVSIRIDKQKAVITTARAARGERPWVPKPQDTTRYQE